MGKEKQQLSFGENFMLSGAAAIISKTASAPIERVKLLVQNQDEMIKQGRLETPYKGVVDCTLRTFRSEGVCCRLLASVNFIFFQQFSCIIHPKSVHVEINKIYNFEFYIVFLVSGVLPFWRGNLANCIRYFPTQALNFAFKDTIKKAFNPQKTDSYGAKFAKNIASGGAAGAMSLCFVYSLDYARTRLANDAKSSGKGGGERQFNGLVDVYRKTLKSDGFVGLYRGFVISCVGIVVYRGFYFGLYDTLKPMLLGDDSGLLLSFALGWVVTVSSGLLSYPIDTIRRRMMMTSGQAVKYKGSIDCGRIIIQTEGFMSLMKGAGANVLRGVAGAGVLAGFDKFQSLYIQWRLGA